MNKDACDDFQASTGGGNDHIPLEDGASPEAVESGVPVRRSGSPLSVLIRVSNAVRTSPDLPELYRAIHAVLREFIDATNFSIALGAEGPGRLEYAYPAEKRDNPCGHALALDVLRTGEPLLAHAGEGGLDAAVWLGAPLKAGERAIGVMAVHDHEDPGHYCRADMDLLVAVAEQLAMAVERKRMKERLRLSEQRCRLVSDSAFNMESWRGVDGTLLYMSPSCERITGYPPEAFSGDPRFMERLVHEEDVDLWRESLRCAASDAQPAEIRFFKKNGSLHWLSVVCRTVYGEDGESLGVRSSMRDITEQKSIQEKLRYANLHDSLTGLANRNLCLDRIRQVVARSKRRGDFHFAVLFLDVDRFRVINDSMGHAAGDVLLKEVAARLLHCVRGLDTVSRYGGDEFVVVLDELENRREAIRAAKRVREAMSRPFFVAGREMRLTMSVGIVLSPQPEMRAEAILSHANVAMHQAEGCGGDRIKVFSPRMLEKARQVLDMEHDLRRALARGEFFLQYQPIVDINRDCVMGFEALVRWNHPDKGVLGPGSFVPFAEESGQILELGEMVLDQACSTMAGWIREHPEREDLYISVNLSCRQFRQPGLVEQVQAVLLRTGLPAANLKLEITESAVMDNPESALSMLRRLKERGVRLSIDDFGTGYSSLSYLQRFPVDTLKVDRSFISGMGASDENVAIVRAVLVLAETLGLDVVAEGVEEAVQLDLLRGLRCDYVQGFYYSRPLAPERAFQYMSRGGSAPLADPQA
ncbi:putative bifunctional diguanylate cyclase/phosphodiesterase [Desulfocurvus sp. DL9XJH121]